MTPLAYPLVPIPLVSGLAATFATQAAAAVTVAPSTPLRTIIEYAALVGVGTGLVVWGISWGVTQQRVKSQDEKANTIKQDIIARMDGLVETTEVHATERREAIAKIHDSIAKLELSFVRESASLKIEVAETIDRHIKSCPGALLVNARIRDASK